MTPKELATPKFKSAKEEAEYWEARTRGPIGPDAKMYVPKPGHKGTSLILPLTAAEIDELGRIAVKQGVSFDRIVQTALRETIRRYEVKQSVSRQPAPVNKSASVRAKKPVKA